MHKLLSAADGFLNAEGQETTKKRSEHEGQNMLFTQMITISVFGVVHGDGELLRGPKVEMIDLSLKSLYECLSSVWLLIFNLTFISSSSSLQQHHVPSSSAISITIDDTLDLLVRIVLTQGLELSNLEFG